MKYLYTIRIPFECGDDMDARVKLNDIRNNILYQPEIQEKLQEIEKGKEPRKVWIKTLNQGD